MRRSSRLCLVMAIVLLASSGLFTPDIRGQEPQAKPDDAKHETLVYPVRGNDPKVVATALQKLYQGDSSVSVQMLGDGPLVLIRVAGAAQRSEVLKALQQLDRVPQEIQLSVYLLESTKGNTDSPTLPKTADRLASAVAGLASSGGVTVAGHWDFTAAEGRSTDVQLTGTPMQSTSIQVKPAIKADKQIELTMKFQRRDSTGEDARPRQFVFGSTVRLVDNQVRLLQSSTSTTASGPTQWLVAGVRLVDPAATAVAIRSSTNRATGFRPTRTQVSAGSRPARTGFSGGTNRGSSQDSRSRLAEAIMKRFDSNGDGKIDRSELKQMPAQYADGDVNKDGTITSSELIKWIKTRTSGGRTPTRQPPARTNAGRGAAGRGGPSDDSLRTIVKNLMQRFDTNKDGFLTDQEWRVSPSNRGGIDKDKDGKYSEAEVLQYYRARSR